MSTVPSGRVALVTGASSGIGRAVARRLAAEGLRVGAMARRGDRLASLATDLDQEGQSLLPLVADVSDRGAVESAVERLRTEFGPVDVLVNNAGVMPVAPLTELRVDDWERMVDVNVKGVLYGLAAVLPDMLERQSGHVVMIGSVAGRRPFPGGTVYAATKFAVRALVMGMQLELSSTEGIRVTDIQPGVVDTELQDHHPDPARTAAFEEGWKERRMLAPEDIADAVWFALDAPARMNVNEILVRPTDQPT